MLHLLISFPSSVPFFPLPISLSLCPLPQVNEECCDSELLTLLLDAGVLVQCVNSALYPLLVSHMLSQGSWDVDAAARQLQQGGHHAQAGALLLAHRGAHPALTTFSTALSVLRKWI